MESPSILDSTVIDDLVDMFDGDRGILHELIDVFVGDAPQQVASLLGAFEEGDLASTRGVAHSLKSSSATLGGTALSELCRLIEQSGGSGAEIESLVHQVPTAFQETRSALVIERNR